MNKYKRAMNNVKFSPDFEEKLILKLKKYSQENNSYSEDKNAVADLKEVKTPHLLYKTKSQTVSKRSLKNRYLVFAAAAVACVIAFFSIISIINSITYTSLNKVSGIVLDAVNAQAVDKTEIIFLNKSLEKVKNKNGDNITAKTDAKGNFEAEVPTEACSAAITRDGYIESYVDLSADKKQSYYISPIMNENTFRAVLTWEETADLDAYLTMPDGKNGRFNLFYDPNEFLDSDGNVIANLDIDNMYGDGPETITFTPESKEAFRFSVVAYSALKNNDNQILAKSRPTVTLYRGNALVGQYKLTQNKACNVWTVFEVNSDEFTYIDTVSTVNAVTEVE